MITKELKAIANERKEEVKELARLKKQILDQPTDIPDGLAVEYLTRYFVFTAFNHFIYNCHCNYDLRFNFIELCIAIPEYEIMDDEDENNIFNTKRKKNCFNKNFEDIKTIEDAIEYICPRLVRIRQRKECKDCLDGSPFFPYTGKNRYFESNELSSEGSTYRIWFEDINKEFNKFVLNKKTIDTLFNNINELGFFVTPVSYHEDREYFCLTCTVEMPTEIQYLLGL